MKSKLSKRTALIVVAVVIIISSIFAIYVLYFKSRTPVLPFTSPESTVSITNSATANEASSTPSMENRLVLSGSNFDFYCAAPTGGWGDAGPDACQLMFTDHGKDNFKSTNDDFIETANKSIFHSSDGKRIIVVESTYARMYDGTSSAGVTVYSAPNNTEFGIWSALPSFDPDATQTGSSTVRLYLYPADTDQDYSPNGGPADMRPKAIKYVDISF